jgi:hypothetical protein
VQALDINNGAEPEDGFVLATVLMIVLALWHAVLAIRRRRLPAVREPTLLPPGAVCLDLPEHLTRR